MRLPVPEPCQIVRPWYAWRPRVHYDCPSCGDHLESPEREIGSTDHCPLCHAAFTVPGDDELRMWRARRAEFAQTNHRAAVLAIVGVIIGAIIIGAISSRDLVSIADESLPPLDGSDAPFETPPVVQASDASTRWRLVTSISPIDDSKTVALSLPADAPIYAWPGRISTPTLHVRWEEGELDVFLWIGGPTNSTSPDNATSVTLRFDDREASDWRGRESTNREAVFFSRAEELVEDMIRADRLTVRFTPFHSNPQTTTFELRGIAKLIGIVEEARGVPFATTPATLIRSRLDQELRHRYGLRVENDAVFVPFPTAYSSADTNLSVFRDHLREALKGIAGAVHGLPVDHLRVLLPQRPMGTFSARQVVEELADAHLANVRRVYVLDARAIDGGIMLEIVPGVD